MQFKAHTHKGNHQLLLISFKNTSNEITIHKSMFQL